MKIKNASTILSCIAIILSLFAIGGCLFVNRNNTFDSMMFAIAMLSAMVVVLMGWNIWNSVRHNQTIKTEIEEAKNSLHQENLNNADTAIYLTHASLAGVMAQQLQVFSAFELYAKAALMASKVKNKELVEEYMSASIQAFEQLKTSSVIPNIELQRAAFKANFRDENFYIDMIKLISDKRGNQLIRDIIDFRRSL